MTNLSLCSGYGGLDAAVEQITGNKTLVYAENDKYAAQVMAARFPWASNLGDISKVDWRALAGDIVIDSLSAGFPCRNISNAGTRDGINGQWSKVWKNVAQAVGVFRPRIVFLENVQAILSRGLDVVAADLAEIGYDARWTCLPAAEVGAPHLRRRWFCVAHPAASDPERSGRYRWPGDLAETDGWTEPADRGDETAGAVRGLSLLPTPTASNPNDGEALEPWEARRQRNLAKGINGNGQGTPLSIAVSLAALGPEQWVTPDGIDYGPAIRRWEAILGRPAPEPTERTRGDGRGLSARFVEWLMGVDEGWITDLDLPRAQQIKIAGNGAMTRQAVEGYRRLLTADLEAMAA